jgi:hypothetical protein
MPSMVVVWVKRLIYMNEVYRVSSTNCGGAQPLHASIKGWGGGPI